MEVTLPPRRATQAPDHEASRRRSCVAGARHPGRPRLCSPSVRAGRGGSLPCPGACQFDRLYGPIAPADAVPIEVSVHGSKRSSDDIGSDAFKAQDTRTTPGTFGDPFQALATLPGIAPMASGLPYFYLRGAPPADTGYFVDGIPVPALFHIGPGPSYVPPELLSRVELFPSTAPAQFGRFVGGVMAGSLTPPDFAGQRDRDGGGGSRGEANLRLFDASAFVETPVGESWDVVAAGRYGYPNLLLSVFAPSLSLGYADYTLRIAHRLSPSDTISVLALGGYDHETDSSQSLPPIDSQFHRIDLRFDHAWSSGAGAAGPPASSGSFRVGATFGYDRTAGVNLDTSGEVVASMSTRLRFEMEQRWGESLRLRSGADIGVEHFGYAQSGTAKVQAIGDEELLGAYADLRFTLAPGVEIVPGVRVDDTQRSSNLPGGKGITVDPKLAARVALTRDISWIATMGVAHQEPSYVLPIPGVVVSAPTGFQNVDQLAGGFETRLRSPMGIDAFDGITLKLTGFYNAEHQVSDFIAACGELLSCGPVGSASGRTYGLELLLRRELSQRFGGWLSYTLSRAERYLGNVPYLSPFDRTHELSAVLHYDFGSGFAAGLRATYYTGRPDFPSLDLGSLSGTSGAGGGGGGGAILGQSGPEISFGPGQIAQHRLPSYYRVDWRFEKRWSVFSGRGSLSAVAEFFNTTLTKEAIEFLCSPYGGVCRASNIGPIALPSIGLEGRW